jgi:ParB family chromosome partitioning protein
MVPTTPNAQSPKRRGLGKGIDLLFAGGSSPRPAGVGPADDRRAVLSVAIEDIHPNRAQPRKTFDPEPLEELAESIRQHGLMQPILVRKRPQGYEIIAGERRWRACQKAGLKTVDVIVKDLSDPDAFTWALIENLQREDLNPIEQATAFKQIIDERSLTQEQLAEMVGKDRSTVANALRLLKLPSNVRRQVVNGALSMGHARALLALESEDAIEKVSREVLRRGLSVRQVEKMVRTLRTKAEGEAAAGASEPSDPYALVPGGAEAVRRETEALIHRLSTRVRVVVTNGKRGKIEIDFSSFDELDRLIGVLKGDARA